MYAKSLDMMSLIVTHCAMQLDIMAVLIMKLMFVGMSNGFHTGYMEFWCVCAHICILRNFALKQVTL